MMALAVVFKKFKSFILFFVTIFKRALCCFRRRRRNSEILPLTQVDVVSNRVENNTFENWNNWNDETNMENFKPNSVQEHIEYYRQKAIAARKPPDDATEAQENFFQDMVPTITRQKKLFINVNNESSNPSSRLSLDPESTFIRQELEEWEENGGWEDETLTFDAREALKESRKLARQKKAWEQQQKKQLSRAPLGAKVSL